MLHLASITDPRWGAQAREHLGEILLDHAHCEKKAAANAQYFYSVSSIDRGTPANESARSPESAVGD